MLNQPVETSAAHSNFLLRATNRLLIQRPALRVGRALRSAAFLLAALVILITAFDRVSYAANNPAPFVDSIDHPVTVAPLGADFTITVRGSGFLAASTVNWTVTASGAANITALATSFVSATELTAVVPAALTATETSAYITVSSPAPGGGASNAMAFQIANPVANLTALNFAAQVTYPVGGGPNFNFVADFNRDGIPDVAVANFGNNTISIYIGVGDGTFATPVNYTVGNGPETVFAADLNGDGFLDLVAPNKNDGTISVLFGNGDGTFQAEAAPSPYTVNHNPLFITAADLNGDGANDLIVLDGASSFSVLLNDGAGTFTTPLSTYTTDANPRSAVVGDFNGDGILDVAIANTLGNSVSVLLGAGSGTFSAQTSYPVGNGAYSITSGDFNNDGWLDLAEINNVDGTISVLLNKADASGGFNVSPTTYATGLAPFNIVSGDSNGDGNLDLIVANRGDATGDVGILLGDGTGAFLAQQTIPVGNFPSVAVGDFNGDGLLDIVSSNYNDGTVSIVLQTPFQVATLTPTTLPFGSVAPTVASAAQTVTLQNTGNANLGSIVVSVTGTNASDFGQTNTCSATLAPSATCTISVIFTPGTYGAETASINIADDAANSPQTVTLTGTGQAAQATPSPTPVPFGTQALGVASAAQVVTITNTGNVDLTISGITVTGTNSGDFVATPTGCGVAIVANATCTVSIVFTPTVAAAESASLNIAGNENAGPVAVPLTGTGSGAIISPSLTTVPFNNVNVGVLSSAQVVTLTNTGNINLTISGIPLGGTNAADFAVTPTGCSVAIAPAGTCTLSITFTPSIVGPETATVSVVGNEQGSPLILTLTGTGLGAVLSPSLNTVPFNNVNVGVTSAAQVESITNTGNANLNISAITLGGTNGADFAVTPTGCSVAIASSGTCTLSITFTPSIVGSETATISLPGNEVATPVVITLTGTGIGALLSPSLTTVPFGSVNIGATHSAIVVTLTDTGNANLTISGVTLGGANSADFAVTPTGCGVALLPTGTCTLAITFTPTLAATETATISLPGNEVGTPVVLTLTGTGTGAILSPSLTTVPFGSANIGSTHSAIVVTLTDTGNVNLTISGVTLGGANSADFAVTPTGCGVALLPTGTCTLAITFTPTLAAAETATISLPGNEVGTPVALTLTGTGTGAILSPSLTTVPFGSVGVGTSHAPIVVTLTNTGNANLTVSGITLGGTNSADFGVTPTGCGVAIAPSGTCSLSITFTPSLASAEAASISLAGNEVGTPVVLTLTGTGDAVSVTALPNPLSFGNEAIGATTGPQAVVITNTGNLGLTISSISLSGANSADFSATPTGCGATIAAAGTCSVAITFKPSIEGSETASLVINGNQAPNPTVVSLSGTGMGAAVRLSAAALTLGPVIVGSPSTAQTVTITNVGNSALTIGSITVSGANLADFMASPSGCSVSIAVNGTCGVSVVFKPSVATAVETATLVITDNATGTMQTVMLSGQGQDFTVTNTSGTQTVSRPASASFTVDLGPLGGFNQSVAYTCTDSLTGSSCAISPTSPVTLDGNNNTSLTVTVGTTSPSWIAPFRTKPDEKPRNRRFPRTNLWTMIAMMAALLSLRWAMREEKSAVRARATSIPWRLLPLAVLTLAVLSGCGAGSGSPSGGGTTPTGGTPTGAQTVTLTATSGTLSHSVTLALTVN